MKRFTQLVLLAVVSGIALVVLGGPVSPEAVAPVADVVSIEAPMAEFGADLGPMANLKTTAAAWGGCVEPSPCNTHADCGSNGICLINLNYPEVDSDKVCICL